MCSARSTRWWSPTASRGSVCLKTIEGASKVLFGAIKDAMMSTTKGKIGAHHCVKDDLLFKLVRMK